MIYHKFDLNRYSDRPRFDSNTLNRSNRPHICIEYIRMYMVVSLTFVGIQPGPSYTVL